MGSAVMSFKFIAGRLVIEVHDPQWCTPVISDQSTRDVEALEIRYMFPTEVRRADGVMIQIWKWYRRVIDGARDVTYIPAEVKNGDEPAWQEDPTQVFPHPFGFCPVRWIQNTAVQGDIDGEPDCKGVYGNVEKMDGLLSQAAVGAINNADPTMHIGTSDQKLEDLKKGSRHAIRTEKDGTVQYVEMSGGGVSSALEVFDKVDQVTMRAVRCILEEEREGGSMTAEEIRRRYGAMFDRVEGLQQHWSETGIVPFVEMIARAAKGIATAPAVVDAATGVATVSVMAGAIGALPPAVLSGMLDSHDLSTATVAIETKWPELAPPTAAEATAAATAVSVARSARVLSRKSGVDYLGPKFGVRDTAEEMRLLEEEDAVNAATVAGELVAGAEGASPTGATSQADTALTGVQIEALIAIASQAYSKGLPREACVAMARMAFPLANPALLEVAIPMPSLAPVPAPTAPGGGGGFGGPPGGAPGGPPGGVG